MRVNIGDCSLELLQGDITDQDTTAIVNAANSSLAGGGGVDGAIHIKGGPEIMAETRKNSPEGCPTGNAVITQAGQLSCRYVIHAVGPIWKGGRLGEDRKLGEAYRSSLELAVEWNCQSVAFPSLSTGAYRYPVDLAAGVALEAVVSFLRNRKVPGLVRFVLFTQHTLETYQSVLTNQLRESHDSAD